MAHLNRVKRRLDPIKDLETTYPEAWKIMVAAFGEVPSAQRPRSNWLSDCKSVGKALERHQSKGGEATAIGDEAAMHLVVHAAWEGKGTGELTQVLKAQGLDKAVAEVERFAGNYKVDKSPTRTTGVDAGVDL